MSEPVNTDSISKSIKQNLKNRPVSREEQESIGKIVQAVRGVINYALAQLPFLLMDDKGKTVWPEGVQYLKAVHRSKHHHLYTQQDQLVSNYQAGRINRQQLAHYNKMLNIPPITIYDIADVFEHFTKLGHFKINDLDLGLNKLPMHLQIIVGLGFGAGKSMLRNTDAFRELQIGRANMIIDLMNDETTAEAYQLLRGRPYLLNLVTEYLLGKLGIPKLRSAS